ncbi:hypothetical protein VTK56DRAFT_8639 [Thermocarpiscus australiensis]
MSSFSGSGLRFRQLLSARAARPTRIAPFRVSCGGFAHASGFPATCAFTSQYRPKSTLDNRLMEQVAGRLSAIASPKKQLADRAQTNPTDITAQALSMLLPGTFVLPPLSDLPKGLGPKLKFLAAWFKIRATEKMQNFVIKFMSRPTIFKRARFKYKKSVMISTAKALHRSMAEALAAGDKDTINKICTRNLAAPLLASIDARPKSRRYGWELLDYTKKWAYPRIKFHRMAATSKERNAPFVRQVVVAISSRQRRVEYDAQGRVVPGSEKEMEVVENVALGCIVDANTWVGDEWRLIGTVKNTTPESWVEEERLLAALQG